MSGYTLGPWQVVERSGYQEILAYSADCDWYGQKNRHAVAYVDTEVDNQEAHARLIAAAPSLLEPAPNAADFLEQYANFIRTVKADDLELHPYLPAIEQTVQDLRAAIELARGVS